MATTLGSSGGASGLADRLRGLVHRPILRPGTPSPRVGIVGAGFGGIGLGVKLLDAGIASFTIFEKADRVGGVWRDNTYPGCECDVPSFLYSFSFAPKRDWSRRYPGQPEILDYLEHVVDEFGLARYLRLGTEVTAAHWDDAAQVWRVTTGDGETHEFDVFVAATGQLNRPQIPDIEGRDDFAGTAFHSARWRHDHDLAGEHVAIVGTGGSAIQFAPHVAEASAHLTIFQRSAPWVGPKDDDAFSDRARWVFDHVPGAAWAYRAWIYWRFEARYLLMRKGTRMARTAEARGRPLLEQLAEASPRLPREAVVPDSPIGCKRILMANDWYPTLLRDDVEVVTAPIERIVADGVVTADGRHHRVDTIVWGTGFDTQHFLAPIDVRGVGGVSLHDRWRDGAEAHLGITLPGFPNLFLLYGPNTNLGHNSIVFMIEQQIRYTIRAVLALAEQGFGALEVRDDVLARSSAAVQRAAERTVWLESCRNWYKTESGRLTNNWPLPTVLYWWKTREPALDEYRKVPRAAHASGGGLPPTDARSRVAR